MIIQCNQLSTLMGSLYIRYIMWQ